MNNSSSHYKQISDILLDIGTPECIEKVMVLEKNSPNRTNYQFRSLGLKSTDVQKICPVFQKDHSPSITSVSFSYNPELGDKGASILVKSLPLSIQEIGFVDCGIMDEGGLAILNWVKQVPNLKMICIEQNNFSQKLKSEFRTFAKDNPNILVVV